MINDIKIIVKFVRRMQGTHRFRKASFGTYSFMQKQLAAYHEVETLKKKGIVFKPVL